MSQKKTREVQGHPIQVAARRSGLTPDVIRAWERRYQVVDPLRSGTNRRLYTEADIEKLLLLSQATRAGRRIGDVARMTLEELQALVSEDGAAAARVGVLPPGPVRDRTAEQYLASCMELLTRLDGAGLEAALTEASVSLAPPALMEQLIGPLLMKVGEGWQCGTLRVAHEHMTTAVIRSLLGNLRKTSSTPDTAPELVVATPAGQRHELGALMVAVAATADGWRVSYLGADLPAEDIAAAARARDARVVALSIVHPQDDPNLPGELARLRAGLGEDTVLLAGGSAAGAYTASLVEAGGRIVSDLSSLREELQALRSPA